MFDRSGFGEDTTADQVLEGLDLHGKRVLITGASGGLGAEAARALAAKGAEVIITARDLSKAKGVVASVKAATGAELQVETLELGSFKSIRTFAERFRAKHGELDILINNAGIMACPQGKTEDGIELQFGTNHLGHFLLTNLLAPILDAEGRVVSVSSLAHRASPVVFEDIQFERRPYERWSAYGQSKTANILFAVALNTRLKARGIEAFSLHPGAIETDLGRHTTEQDKERSKKVRESGLLKYKSIPAGAATEVYAATAPELAGKGGAYLQDCTLPPIINDPSVMSGVRQYALDADSAERLWTISEELVGQRFTY